MVFVCMTTNSAGTCFEEQSNLNPNIQCDISMRELIIRSTDPFNYHTLMRFKCQ